MQHLASRDFVQKMQSPDNPMSVLLGSGVKTTRWCPLSLKGLQLFSLDPARSATKEISSPEERTSLCETVFESVQKEDLEESFHPVLQAFPAQGEVITLERNDKGVFRFSGMSFRSQDLEKALKRYSF